MSAHTPGPWTADEEENVPFVAWEKPGPLHSYQMIAVMSLCTIKGITEGREEMRANARLIAAAPDLREALEDLLYDACYECGEHKTCRNPYHLKARVAIAKARGEVQS